MYGEVGVIDMNNQMNSGQANNANINVNTANQTTNTNAQIKVLPKSVEKILNILKIGLILKR